MKGIYLRCENCRKFTSTNNKKARKGGHIYCYCGENLSRKRQIYYRLKDGFYRAESNNLNDAYEEYLNAKNYGNKVVSKKVRTGELLNSYLDKYKHTQQEQYRWELIYAYLKDISLTNVTSFVIKDFCNVLRTPTKRKNLYSHEKYEKLKKYGNHNKILSDKGLRYYLVDLRKFFKWCIGNKYIKEIPFDSDLNEMAKNKKTDFNPATISKEESLRLLKASKYSRNKELYLFILISLATGLRKSNVSGMQIEWIDFENNIIVIPKEYTKAKKEIRVPASPILISEIKNYVDKNNISSGNLFKTQDFRRSFTNALKLAGLPHIRIHDLRHSVATNLLRSGTSHYKVKELLAHSSIQITERYLHLIDEDLKNDMVRHQDSLLNGYKERS